MIVWSNYESIATALSTELNSLANNANSSLSALIDPAGRMFMDIELVLASIGTARSAGGTVDVFMSVRLDGTNTSDANEVSTQRVAVLPVQASTAAQRVVRTRINTPPGQFGLMVRNNATGQAFASSGNTLKYRLYSMLAT